jgi:catechol 2,3-dioxygenase-like lactoylglutathione lyase family enzyme
MKLQKVYHMGIPVDNLDRAKTFYTSVLGMDYSGALAAIRTIPIHFPCAAWRKNSIAIAVATTMSCFSNVRAQSIARALDQDGIFHQAFDMAWEDYDDALKQAKALGKFHRSVERDSGNTIYLFDTKAIILELHFPRPGGRRVRQAV